MAKGKKYEYRVIKDEGAGTWTAEITRRVTSRETVVSKSQDGFATESEALAWAEDAIKSFVRNLVKQNVVRTEEQEEKAEKERRWRDNRNKRKSVVTENKWKK